MPVPADTCWALPLSSVMVVHGVVCWLKKLQPQAIPMVIIENSRNKFGFRLKEKGLKTPHSR